MASQLKCSFGPHVAANRSPDSYRDLAGSHNRSRREQKEFFMFPKFSQSSKFSRSHGPGWAAKAAIAGAAFAATGLLASMTSANIIYQDNFSGSASTNLNGAAPTIDNGPSATWTAGNQNGLGGWSDNGAVGLQSTSGTAYLLFTPNSGTIYTLSEGITVTSASSAGYAGLRLEFFSGTLSYKGSSGPFYSPSFTSADYNTLEDVSLVLNTMAAQWTYAITVNGASAGSGTFSTNPTTIDGVGTNGGGSTFTATVSNFSLTDIPEPATLGLMALGGLGILASGRRRRRA